MISSNYFRIHDIKREIAELAGLDMKKCFTGLSTWRDAQITKRQQEITRLENTPEKVKIPALEIENFLRRIK